MSETCEQSQSVDLSLGIGPQRSLRGAPTLGAVWSSSISRKAILLCSSTQLLWDKSSKCSLFELLGANT